ncbi:unnamed protein product [Choristocarpus tenellus]
MPFQRQWTGEFAHEKLKIIMPKKKQKAAPGILSPLLRENQLVIPTRPDGNCWFRTRMVCVSVALARNPNKFSTVLDGLKTAIQRNFTMHRANDREVSHSFHPKLIATRICVLPSDYGGLTNPKTVSVCDSRQ